MAEPTALRLHDNQSFPDQLGYAVHQTAVQTMAHLNSWIHSEGTCRTTHKNADQGSISKKHTTFAVWEHQGKDDASAGGGG
eukprot:scaffold10264_cov51-Attheya_sp.AAC.1